MPVLSSDNNYNFANIFVKESGSFVSTDYIYTKQNNNWEKIANVYKNINGTWTQIWPTTGIVIFDKDTTVTVPPGINYVDILLVGGGGGGGQGEPGHNGGAGGGGGGGVLEEKGIPVVAGTQYNIIIGPGGAAAASNSGNGGGDGGDTSITGCVSGTVVTYKAYGGTGGSGYNGPHGPGSGCCCGGYVTTPYIGPGGSGGGGYSAGDARGVSPPTPGGSQGYAGGYGATNNSVDAGGGGGGAGAAGSAAAVGVGGAGGAGYSVAIGGHLSFYGGGGAGGVTNGGTAGAGGIGGGGSSGQDATDYGGGGGGGGAGGDAGAGTGPNSGQGYQGAVIVNFYSDLAGGPVELALNSGTGKLNIPTGSEISYGQTCFDPNALVYMADGTYKMIKDIVVGDKVLNSQGGVNTVTGIETPVLGNRLMYKFNNNWAFVSEEHPLLTTEGWAAFDPESSAVEAPFKGNLKKITIGTELVKFNGTETVTSIDTETQDPNYVIYNLALDGDHTYVVEGFVVHNKGSCFTEDTVVSMADGTFKDIADVQVGDEVYNYNKTSTNRVVYIESVHNDILPMYSPSDEFAPFATINHPLYINGVLTTATTDYSYPWLDIKNTIDAITAPINQKIVYNLWVDGDHTYIVNGYGTHAIIDDGGFLPELVEKNKLTHNEAMQLIRICTFAGVDIMYGSYIFIKCFKKIPVLWIKTFFARSLLTESLAQKFVLSVFKMSGKVANLIKRFR